MSGKEVTRLRKEGKLDEALSMAESDLTSDPENIWNKRSIAWVYYSLMKANSSPDSFDKFISSLKDFTALELPETEINIFDYCASQVGKMVFAFSREENVEYLKVKELFELIKKFYFNKPSETYSFIYKAFHKGYKNWNSYLEFADWWDFENFRPEDYLEEEFNGKKIMSIVEQAYIAYSKKSLQDKEIIDDFIVPESVNKERLNTFLPKLDSLIESHPEYLYPPYFKAKILMIIGGKENMLSVVIPFAKKKRNDFWVWNLLSEAYPENDDKHLACLCRAVLCKTPEDFLVKVHQKLAAALIKRNFYSEAKTEISKLIEVRNANVWPIPNQVKEWERSDWFQQNTEKDNKPFLKEKAGLADEILFSDEPEQVIVVEHVNKEKKMVNFITEGKTSGFCRYQGKIEKLVPGSLLKVRIKAKDDGGLYELLTFNNYSQNTEKLVKNFSGQLKISSKGFGFVDDVFIEGSLIEANHLVNYNQVKGIAMVSFNRNKNCWGWKGFKIENRV